MHTYNERFIMEKEGLAAFLVEQQLVTFVVLVNNTVFIVRSYFLLLRFE